MPRSMHDSYPSSSAIMSEGTFELFPAPSSLLAKSLLPAPRIWSGSPAAIARLRWILEDNHIQHQVFVFRNNLRFHNHTAHAALARWSLGADEEILDVSYQLTASYSHPLFSSPHMISRDNWRNHLTDTQYYHAYLTFFVEELKQKRISDVLEEYLFAPSSNFVPCKGKQPQMLNRFLDGLMHPMIHVGHGLEFGLPGTVAEGLAMAAGQYALSTRLIPASFFSYDAESFEPQRPDVKIRAQPSVEKSDAFTIFARVLADTRFEAVFDTEQSKIYANVMKKHGTIIKGYVDQWNLESDVVKGIEELVWISVVMYGVGGRSSGGSFNADLHLMHFVTSVIFLPLILAHLKPQSQSLLLRSYFSVIISWYIGRGRPAINVARFYETTEAIYPTSACTHLNSSGDTPPELPSQAQNASNSWSLILKISMVHPDDHLPKLQRSLKYCSDLFGDRKAGYFSATELKDAELLDGTLFLRVAGLTATRMGMVTECEPPSTWDRIGFYSCDGDA